LFVVESHDIVKNHVEMGFKLILASDFHFLYGFECLQMGMILRTA